MVDSVESRRRDRGGGKYWLRTSDRERVWCARGLARRGAGGQRSGSAAIHVVSTSLMCCAAADLGCERCLARGSRSRDVARTKRARACVLVCTAYRAKKKACESTIAETPEEKKSAHSPFGRVGEELPTVRVRWYSSLACITFWRITIWAATLLVYLTNVVTLEVAFKFVCKTACRYALLPSRWRRCC